MHLISLLFSFRLTHFYLVPKKRTKLERRNIFFLSIHSFFLPPAHSAEIVHTKHLQPLIVIQQESFSSIFFILRVRFDCFLFLFFSYFFFLFRPPLLLIFHHHQLNIAFISLKRSVFEKQVNAIDIAHVNR